MANCKFCGKPVTVTPVVHPECWQEELEKVMGKLCDGFCMWPRVCQDDARLIKHHCMDCPVFELVCPGGRNDVQDVMDAPAADVASVRHGRWIKRGYACGENEYECSVCHETEWRTSASRMKYCMFCGARMDGGDEDA